MRKFIVVLLLTGLVWSYGAVAQSPTAPLVTFPSEQQAQQHCPADTVVWVPSGSSVLDDLKAGMPEGEAPPAFTRASRSVVGALASAHAGRQRRSPATAPMMSDILPKSISNLV